jgi:gamma-glutamyltranspeptidase/glutathione hydrolase
VSPTTRPTLLGSFGMVSTTHWLAASSAMRMLELGGNAADAACAGAFVLHVVEPHLNGPGGDVPMLVGTAGGDVQVLCGQGSAPSGATISHYRGLGLTLVPGAGLLAAVVPGAMDAWLLLLLERGSLPLREVLGPAIEYAEHGYPLTPGTVRTIAAVERLFREHWTTSAAQWLPMGRLPDPGDLVTNRPWAATLQRLVAEAEAAGPDRDGQIEAARTAWAEGFVAAGVDAFARIPARDSSGNDHAGVITGQDLAAWRATWEQPAMVDFLGYQVAKTRAWSQGPALLQTLQLLSALGDPGALDPSSADGIHAQVEAVKLAFADREAWYGDSADVPLTALLDPAYAAERARLIGPSASTELRPGRPGGAEPRLAPEILAGLRATALGATDGTTGEPTVAADREPHVGHESAVVRGDTCHIAVADRHGTVIAATPSGGWLQSSPYIPDLGFCLGSRGQMFWLTEGLPSSLKPGARPRTTLSPTMVLRDGVPVLGCGSPGGDQQEQWQLPFLLRVLAGGQSLQEAIDAPTFNTASFPSSFYPRASKPGSLFVEDRIDDSVQADLAARGHTVSRTGAWSQGYLCAVARDPQTGQLSAGANPRGAQGYAVGR